MFGDQSEEDRVAQLREWSEENVIERILLKQEAIKRAEVIESEKIEAAFSDMKKGLEQDGKKIRNCSGHTSSIAHIVGAVCQDNLTI